MNFLKTPFLYLLFSGLLFISCKVASDDLEGKLQNTTTTSQDLEKWKLLAKDHLPNIVVHQNKVTENLDVLIQENKFSKEHYIEKIGVMNIETKDVINESVSKKGIFQTSLTLNLTKANKYAVFVKCNQHNLWTIPLHTYIQ